MPAPSSEGVAVIVSGRSRSGKSAWTKQATRDAPRLIVWDPDDEWSDAGGKMQRVTSLERMCRIMWGSSGAGFRVRYVPDVVSQDLHGAWAGTVLAWGQGHDGMGLAAVSDELADVTSPGKASAGWGQLVRRGLKRGISLYSISQRWAEADKSTFGNCSRVVCFASSSEQDVRYLSSRVRVPAEVLSGLKRLEYVDFSTVTGEYSRGVLSFPSKKRPGTDTDTAHGHRAGAGAESGPSKPPRSGLLLE